MMIWLRPVENGICQFSEEIVRPGKPEQARPSDDYLTDEQIWAISSILVPGFGKDRRDLEHRDLMIKIHCMMLERDKDEDLAFLVNHLTSAGAYELANSLRKWRQHRQTLN